MAISLHDCAQKEFLPYVAEYPRHLTVATPTDSVVHQMCTSDQTSAVEV